MSATCHLQYVNTVLINAESANAPLLQVYPLKVIILAPRWRCLTVLNTLAIQLAKIPGMRVTLFVPEEDSCSERDKREAARHGVTIVEAKKQPGFDDPVDWLNFPPQDLATDIVVGVGERLGKIAEHLKESLHCKSIYVALDPDDQDLTFQGTIDKNTTLKDRELRHQRNVGLCQAADLPIAIGPKMTEKLSASLCFDMKKVFNLTPGLLSKFCEILNENHATNGGGKFRVLVLDSSNRGGLDIAAKAVAELDDRSYHLFYVNAAEVNQKQFSKNHGISESQLTIRSPPKCEEDLKRLLCEVDLAIMPSGEQGFEMIALAALSAGLPILVHGDSGFGEALREVESGTSSTVDSEDAKVWAKAIKKVRETERKERLEQAATQRAHYNEKFSWEEQCGDLANKMSSIVSVSPESQDQGKSTGVTFQKSVESENCVPVHTISSLGQDCTGKTRFEKVPSGPSEEQSEGMETVDQVTSKDCQLTDLEEKKQEDIEKCCSDNSSKCTVDKSGSFSSSGPLHVAVPYSSSQSTFAIDFAIKLAKIPWMRVTLFVPEEDSCSEKDKREAASYGITIVEAKEQPGFDDPVDWLIFPPQDLTTDIVVGVGERLGKIAQLFKERHHCKSVFVASNPLEEMLFEGQHCLEKLASITNSSSQIMTTVQLSRMADIPVAIGPKMADELSASLRFYRKKVFELPPGILSDLSDVSHAIADRRKFRVLISGGFDPENFYEEGLHTAANAVAELKDKSYVLLFVCVSKAKQVQFAEKFYHCGVAQRQLTIQSFPRCVEDLKRLFCKADLAIMPSSKQGFGMALAALSAGLPILVHEDSECGEALREVETGTSWKSTVDSDDAKVWAKAIKKVRETDRKTRLEQAALLRSHYDEKYSWEKPCEDLIKEMFTVVCGTSNNCTHSTAKQKQLPSGSSTKSSNEISAQTTHNQGSSVKRKRESPSCTCTKRSKHTSAHRAVKGGTPENDDLERLAKEVVKEWKVFGRRLLENDEAALDAIHKDNEECCEKAFKMLLKWKQAKGATGATFQVLHDALCHPLVDRKDLAEKFCLVDHNC
ncbi:hypothetical protein ACROYT_G030865 [Oculina patagonica]